MHFLSVQQRAYSAQKMLAASCCAARVRRSFSLKAKKSEKSLLAKKMFFFALFACKRNTSKSENNESEMKRTKRIIASIWTHLQPTPISLALV
jgi:hypothetical protein